MTPADLAAVLVGGFVGFDWPSISVLIRIRIKGSHYYEK